MARIVRNFVAMNIGMLICAYSLMSNPVVELGVIYSHDGEGDLVREGIELALSRINKVGGLQGAAGQLMSCTESGDPADVMHCASELAERGPLAILDAPLDARVWSRMHIEQPPLLWGLQDRSGNVPSDTLVIATAPPLIDEIRALCGYARDTAVRRTCAILHDDSAWGMRALQLTKELLAQSRSDEQGLTYVGSAQVASGTVNVDLATKALALVAPQVILCFASRRATYQFILQSINLKGQVNTLFMGPSSLFVLQRHLKQSRGIDFIATSIVPDVHDESVALVSEYHADFKAAGRATLELPSELELASYWSTRLLGAVADTVSGVLTPTSLALAARAVTSMTVGGLPVKFDAASSTLSQLLWLSPGFRKPFIPIHS